jgi:hypothetical protein
VYGVHQGVDVTALDRRLLGGEARLIEQDDRIVMPANGLDLLAHDQKASVGA